MESPKAQMDFQDPEEGDIDPQLIRSKPLWKKKSFWVVIAGLTLVAIVAFIVVFIAETGHHSSPKPSGPASTTPAPTGVSTNSPMGTPAPAKLISVGFTNDTEAQLRRMQFASLVQNDTIRAYMKQFSAMPHIAGSQRNLDLAETVAQYWRDFGWDEVRVEHMPVQLADNYTRHVALLNNSDGSTLYTASIEEPNLLNETDYEKAIPPLNGYSGNGTAVGSFVWANFGRKTDYDTLADLGVSLHGRIVVCRYGRIFRGDKAHLAEMRGAIGVIIVMDPHEMEKGKPFPEGPWATNLTAQRGSIYTGDGDPRTPSWPAEYGGPSLTEKQLFEYEPSQEHPLPTIPIQPMGYGDARFILKGIDGGVSLPASWQDTGFLSEFSRGIGPTTNVNLTLTVNRTLVVKDIANVIGTIYGSVEKDRFVMLGSHRDAWTYGAADPISGQSCVLEFARSMGEMLKTGWRPRRSIQVYSWDAEEWAIIGSTEYAQTQVELLRQRAIAYLNLDVAVDGHDKLDLSGSPSFESLTRIATSEVKLPNGTELESIAAKKISPSGSGSDHMPFIQLAGVPVLDSQITSFDGQYEAVYHTNYDSLYWMETFADPTFQFHQTLTRFIGNIALQLADQNVIPLNTVDYATAVQGWTADYKSHNTTVDFSFLQNAADKFSSAASQNMAIVRSVDNAIAAEFPEIVSVTPFELRALNDRVMGLERVFLGYGKLETGSTFYKHVLFTPSSINSYGATVMPIIANALATGDVEASLFAIGRVGQFVSRAGRYLNMTTA